MLGPADGQGLQNAEFEELDRNYKTKRENLINEPSLLAAFYRSPDSTIGPLGKAMALQKRLREHPQFRWRTRKFAEELHSRLPGRCREKSYFSVTAIKAWLQPSSYRALPPHASEAAPLASAVTRLAEDTLGSSAAAVVVGSFQEPSDLLKRLVSLEDPRDQVWITDHQIDPGFQHRLSLDRPELVEIGKDLLLRLRSDFDSGKPFILVGEPHSGKKSVVSYLLHNPTNGALLDSFPIDRGIRLPIFAKICKYLTYRDLVTQVAAFLNVRQPVDDKPSTYIEILLDRIAEAAGSRSAFYVLADLNVVDEPIGRFIRDRGIVRLLHALLDGNDSTRVLITSTDSIKQPRMSSESHLLQQAVERHLEPPSLVELRGILQPWHPPRLDEMLSKYGARAKIDGVFLDLSAALVKLSVTRSPTSEDDLLGCLEHALKTCFGHRDGSFRRSAGNCLLAREDYGVLCKAIYDHLKPVERKLVGLIAAADDGIRQSTLISSMLEYEQDVSSAEIKSRLWQLQSHLPDLLRVQRLAGPWPFDDLPGRGNPEDLFHIPDIVRDVICYHWDQVRRERGEDRDYHLLIAKAARQQAHCRRLNSSGTYGDDLDDLVRDTQSFLELLAWVDPGEIGEGASGRLGQDLLPMSIERLVFEGKTDARTSVRFAYLHMYCQDIDRDFRISNFHDRDDLRLTPLVALFHLGCRYRGQPHGLSMQYRCPDLEVPHAGFERLRGVFSDTEMASILTSLSLAAQRCGEMRLLRDVTALAGELLEASDPKELGPHLTKLWRAEIDSDVLHGGRDDGQGRRLEASERYTTRLLMTHFSEELAAKSVPHLEARLKLLLRLGEIQHLRGLFRQAVQTFQKAEVAERALGGGEVCQGRRPALPGHGARRYLRLLWDLAELARSEPHSSTAVADCCPEFAAVAHANDELRADLREPVELHRLVEKAGDVWQVSVRRLSRHAGDRPALLLDRAGNAFMKRHQDGQAYDTAFALIERAEQFRLESSLSWARRLELDTVNAEIAIAFIKETRMSRSRRLEDGFHRAERSIRRLRKLIETYHQDNDRVFAPYQIECWLLQARLKLAAAEADLEPLTEECRLEIDHYLDAAGKLMRNIGYGCRLHIFLAIRQDLGRLSEKACLGQPRHSDPLAEPAT